MLRIGQYEVLQLLPFVTLIFILCFIGLHQMFIITLRSPINFQQGLHNITHFRSAFCSAILTLSPILCVLPFVSTRAIIFYLFGYVLVFLPAALFFVPILHYIPSPSICRYISMRFNSPSLRIWVAALQIIIIICYAIVLLSFLTVFTVEITKFSTVVICALFGFFASFAVIFSGYNIVTSNIFIVQFTVITIGIGSFVYNSMGKLKLKDNLLFKDNSRNFLSDIATFSVGLLNGLHFASSSPLLYQQYFPFITTKRLKASVLLHIVIFAILSTFLIMMSSVYEDYLTENCSPHLYTAINFTHFLYFWFQSDSIPSLLVLCSIMCIIVSSISLALISIATILWEDLLKKKFAKMLHVHQLRVIQASLIIIGVIVTICSLLCMCFNDNILLLSPHIFTTLSAAACPITAVYLSGYVIPCTNWQTVLLGAINGYIVPSLMFFLKFPSLSSITSAKEWTNSTYRNDFTDQEILWIENTIGNSNSSILFNSTEFGMRISSYATKIANFFQYIPLLSFPAISFLASMCTVILLSFCLSGRNPASFERNLVVYSSLPRLWPYRRASTSCRRNAFIESESFRYAQQTPYPETNYYSSKSNINSDRSK